MKRTLPQHGSGAYKSARVEAHYTHGYNIPAVNLLLRAYSKTTTVHATAATKTADFCMDADEHCPLTPPH
jgi:hypothetical protein